MSTSSTIMTPYINWLCERANETAWQHGWWDEPPEFGTLIALCHSELSEALEEFRKGRGICEVYIGEKGGPEGIPIELADVIIRIFDLCGHYGIDLSAAIREKMVYNESRPYKHGGKVI